MRIASADAGWLRLFRFSPGEVLNKTLAICYGPKTKLKDIESLVGSRAAAPTWVTFYDKGGSEVVMAVRRHGCPTCMNAQGDEDNVTLEMKSVDSFSCCSERSEQQDDDEMAAAASCVTTPVWRSSILNPVRV